VAETQITATAPLDGVQPLRGKGIALAPQPFMARLTLRGDGNDPVFARAAARVLGVELPRIPCRFSGTGIQAHWAGPDEWAVEAPADAATGGAALAAKLETALDGLHAQVVDVSDYYTGIRLSGPHARDVIAAGSPLDVHPQIFQPGHCAGTRHGHVAIFLARRDGEDIYDLRVRWSFADYLWRQLATAAREFL